jgi:mono/diheme cytochrome c family protein
MKGFTLPMFMAAMLMWAAAIRSANAQMMGSHMGGMMGQGTTDQGMMGGGHMRSMRVLMSWMHGGEIEAHPSVPEPRLDADMRSLGARLYSEHCAVCHGVKGDGNGERAAQLSPRARDFTKGVYEFRSTPSGKLPTDEDLWTVISDGLHGTAMVPWISLSESSRWALVAYVESFSPRFATETRATPLTVPKPPAETQELIEQGRKLYVKVGCANCHGLEGHGDGPALRGEAVRPRDFTGGIFKRGSSMDDLYLTLRTGLNGTPMLSFEKALTPDESWALAAYVRSLIVGRGQSPATASANEAIRQQRLGMMIDMPGMGPTRMMR